MSPHELGSPCGRLCPGVRAEDEEQMLRHSAFLDPLTCFKPTVLNLWVETT